MNLSVVILLLVGTSESSLAWTGALFSRRQSLIHCRGALQDEASYSGKVPDTSENQRRTLIQSVFLISTAALSYPTPSSAEVVRAVGSGEIACREAGNCLEIGELDGAVGWSWGGKDRTWCLFERTCFTKTLGSRPALTCLFA